MRADLQLDDAEGAAHRLSEWDGKLVLLNFWATWCGPCREEMPLLSETQQRFSANGLEVVGIAIDNASSVQDFLKNSPVRYPILVGGDDEDNPSLLFGDTRSVLPYSVLIGRDGKVVAQRAGSFSADGLVRWLQPHLGVP
jgi:thiol-disulfide isomerase/thioredoxin